MLEARLLVRLADHVHAHRGIGRLAAARTVAEAELAISNAKVEDVSPAAATILSDAVGGWLRGRDVGRDVAPLVHTAFWLDRIERVQFQPVKFRLHVGAPACARPEENDVYHLQVDPERACPQPGGTLEAMRLGPYRGERGSFPDDVVVWWEGARAPVDWKAVADLVQPGSTFTVVRPRRGQWWLGWAGLDQGDQLADILYRRYKFSKLFVGEDQDFEFVVSGIEGLKA